ncbi:metal-sensitive transcriptional regulator [Corynebacterium caspium]|uniref:metal-sensitive transcriptional regulator n=1 Tax=Corynebacterium caspium TaxID=234828 RepID=UPI00036A40F0|nr:metal-sensitive transcriptional regulator [Corynebacterium caspium]WKD58759.1 Copper-sensing transcriptional repressor CsoR [Corynebacterium caspium DSM 44850]
MDIKGETPQNCCANQNGPASKDQTYGYTPEKARYLARLKRVEGQVRGIHRMIQEDEYCIDVVTQISAATSALQNLAIALMEDHLHHCVANAVRDDTTEGDEKITEAMKAIQRMMKR